MNSIHKDDGKLITSDPHKTASMILQHRVAMAQIPISLPLDRKVVYKALDDIAQHNSSVRGIASTSVGVLTALQPDYFWQKSELRRWVAENEASGEERGYVSGYGQWREFNSADPNRNVTTMASYCEVQSNYGLACGKLNVPIRMEEVKVTLSTGCWAWYGQHPASRV